MPMATSSRGANPAAVDKLGGATGRNLYATGIRQGRPG